MSNKSVSRIDCVCKTCGTQFQMFRSQVEREGRGQFCNKTCRDNYGKVSICCAWPGCDEVLVCHAITHQGKPSYRVGYGRVGVKYQRNPVCESHKNLISKNLGKDHRIQGRMKWFSNPEVDLGSRVISSLITRLAVFDKTDGRCACCAKQHEFQSSGQWEIDHIVPVYKGGKTNWPNLQILCVECHTSKTSVEKREVAFLRHKRQKLNRWMTHPQKDAVIADLRAEIERLNEKISILEGPQDEQAPVY